MKKIVDKECDFCKEKATIFVETADEDWQSCDIHEMKMRILANQSVWRSIRWNVNIIQAMVKYEE